MASDRQSHLSNAHTCTSHISHRHRLYITKHLCTILTFLWTLRYDLLHFVRFVIVCCLLHFTCMHAHAVQGWGSNACIAFYQRAMLCQCLQISLFNFAARARTCAGTAAHSCPEKTEQYLPLKCGQSCIFMACPCTTDRFLRLGVPSASHWWME